MVSNLQNLPITVTLVAVAVRSAGFRQATPGQRKHRKHHLQAMQTWFHRCDCLPPQVTFGRPPTPEGKTIPQRTRTQQAAVLLPTSS